VKQQEFFKTHWQHRFCHGGSLRQSSRGRKARPLSSKDPHHIVFKVNKIAVKGGLRSAKNFSLLLNLMKKYGKKFFIKIEQVSIQNDHVHLLIRAPRRACFQSFFRVLAGQFSQCLTDTFREPYDGPRIWKYRPFSRVVKGYKAYQTVRNYLQLNEKEAQGRPYRKERLRGFDEPQLEELWATETS
jgi:REP element-mobilizing transposase RayT